MALNAAQIFTLARNAGLSVADAITATAVAFAESGGNPNDRYNPGPEDSYGLWQINMDPSYRAERLAQLGLSSPSQLFDPATNARAMAMLSSHGKNWQPWTTYTSGKYQQFLSQAQAAAGGAPASINPTDPLGLGPAAGQSASDLITSINAITQSLKNFSDFMANMLKAAAWIVNPVNDLRILSAIWGTLIVLGGLVLLALAA